MLYYTNPRGLYPFQSLLAAYCVLRPNNLAVVDTGLGKTHLALAAASMLLEDGAIDHAVFVVEKNKIEEWQEDFAAFTSLGINTFYGPKRELRPEQVTLTTYSTLRDSLVTVHPADNRVLYLTESAEWFVGKRMLVVCDEAAIFGGSRISKTYRTFEQTLNHWRQHAEIRMLSMTATPLERSPENFYNIVALMLPDWILPYPQWAKKYVTATNRWDMAWQFKNMDEWAEELSGVLLRKRKTDDDVKAQFPETVEKFVGVTLSQAHLAAYRSLDEWIDRLHPNKQLPAFRALNAFVCHPRSIFYTQWEEAQEWAASYGTSKIEKLKSNKAQRLIHDVQSIVQAGDPGGVLVFCHSVSALRCLADDIRALPADERFEFVEYHGARTDVQNREAKAAFRAGGTQVMLASSKAERGVNLPEAHYIRMFDVPTRHSEYVQRLNRGSRIGSNVGGTLSVKSFVANGTIEQASVGLWNRRNDWSDQIQDRDALLEEDENFVTAHQRMMAIRAAARDERNAA